MTLSFSTVINGKPNYFIEKIWTGLDPMITPDYYCFNEEYVKQFGKHWDGAWTETTETNFPPKLHTIRQDEKNRWGAGCDIHFVINNRTPNRFQFAPVIKCVSVQEIEIKSDNQSLSNGYSVNFKTIIVDGKMLDGMDIYQLAINDGFDSVEDFFAYFNKDFTGKLIHWTDLKY